jgi:hypothetical protein
MEESYLLADQLQAIGRQVLRERGAIGNDVSSPGSVALWAKSFTIVGFLKDWG